MTTSKEHMTAVRSLPCLVCELNALGDSPSCAHHTHTGAGGRKNDWFVINLCHYHHQGPEGIHTLGRKAWEKKYGTEEELLYMVTERCPCGYCKKARNDYTQPENSS